MSCVIETDRDHYLQKYLGPSVMTANYLGGILNSLGIFAYTMMILYLLIFTVFGFISDKYGRKFTFSIANILYIIIRWVDITPWNIKSHCRYM